MPSPTRLQYGAYYHIFNRGNNRENIFVQARNYPYFLRLYARHVAPVAETFAYCLLKNHFHLAVRIKSEEKVTVAYQALNETKSFTPSHAFSNFFNAYAKSINKAYGRTGSLFQNPFNRIPVENRRHLLHLVVYIHHNPQQHGFVQDFRDWPYSSFFPLLQKDEGILAVHTVMDFFDGPANFRESHLQTIFPHDFDPRTHL